MKMIRWPYWLKGGVTGILYLVVLIPLTQICPPDAQCITDVFVKPLLFPLLVADAVLPFWKENVWEHGWAFLFSFWFFAGALGGAVYGKWKKKEVRKLPIKNSFDDDVPKPPKSINIKT